jgi:hypothetical protein
VPGGVLAVAYRKWLMARQVPGWNPGRADHGQFLVQDPDGNLVRFGSPK